MLKTIASRASSICYRFLTRGVPDKRFDQQKLKAEGYLSQCGQDKWIAEVLCPARTAGVFVDIGANDGVSFSNTCILERKLGWTGIAVEPLPDVFEKLKANRRCILVNGCISSREGTAKFHAVSGYAEMLSGLVDEYDSRHRQRIASEVAKYGGTCREIEVACYDFNTLLDRHGINRVDYLNIDTEGAEYKILKSIDFGRFDIAVIGVENNYADCRIPLFLRGKGYVLHSVVGDEFYVKRRDGVKRRLD